MTIDHRADPPFPDIALDVIALLDASRRDDYEGMRMITENGDHEQMLLMLVGMVVSGMLSRPVDDLAVTLDKARRAALKNRR